MEHNDLSEQEIGYLTELIKQLGADPCLLSIVSVVAFAFIFVYLMMRKQTDLNDRIMSQQLQLINKEQNNGNS
jgi:hypothetical protein